MRASNLSLEDKERMIEDLHQHLEQKYLRHCNTTIVPLHWVAATVARLVIAKMWLVVHHPLQRSDAGAGLPTETKERLFHTSLEVIEFSRLLETEKTTLKWGWLFRTYTQWHAIAFVLSQLCIRTLGPDVDRAWLIINGLFENGGGIVDGSHKFLRKLMAKAKMERAKALQKREMFPLDGSIGPMVDFDTNRLPRETSIFDSNKGAIQSSSDDQNSVTDFSNGTPNFDPVMGSGQELADDLLEPKLLMQNAGDMRPGTPSLMPGPPMMLEENNISFALNWDDIDSDINAMNEASTKAVMLDAEGLTSWF